MGRSVAGETFTLDQLSKIDTAVLQGNNSSYSLYVPIPSQWYVSSLDLNLIIQFSPLLLNSSSLTIMAGDVPIDTIKLDKTMAQPISWKVTIPNIYITPKITTLRLIGYLKINDNESACQEMDNQGNWVTLSGTSTITYNYMNKQSEWSLMEFPYPFIHKNAPFTDKVSFFLPIKMAANDFAPYFKLANVLSKEASWRGIQLDIKTMGDFNETALKYPSVIIGTPDTIDFSLIGKPDTLQLKDNQWLMNDGTPLSPDNGFVWLTSRGPQALLVISANSQKGLSTAIESVSSKIMHFTANNTSFFIAYPVHATKGNIADKKEVSFSELGYKNSVVFGIGQNQLNYEFNLPAQYTNQPIKLLLNYSNSPFLQKDRVSTISVSLNGLPLDGAALEPDSQIRTLALDLPQKQLQLGKNILNVSFTLLLPENFCSRDFLNQAWGTIYDNSSLQFQTSETPINDQIKSYPSRMNGNLLVGLSNDESVYQNAQLVKEMLRFATMLDKNTSLEVSDTQSIKSQTGHNIVYLNTAKDNSPALEILKSTFAQLVKNLAVTTDSALQGFNKSIFMNAFKKQQDVGFVAIRSTETEKNLSELILFGYSPKELNLAVSLLNDNDKLNSLTGNLAVAFQNGASTSLSSSTIDENVQKEITVRNVFRSTINYAWYGLGTLILCILIYIGWRAWRKK